jgi:aspartyl-tRNA synthetase
MISGFDRYFQIARCFRDEDQRADRQLEFTQVDLEMSFVGVDDVLAVLEEVTCRVCREAAGVELPRPFPRLSHAEVMERYGVDRPDTRIDLELVDLTDLFRESDFRAFRAVVDGGGIVKCLPVPEAEALSRGDIDRLESFVRKELGAKGLAWIRVGADGAWQSPIVKFLSETEREAIADRAGAAPGTVLFFQADQAPRANAILARLRQDLGEKLGRTDGRPWDPLFVVDFPLFEREEDGKLTYMHMPFVAPMEEDIPLLGSEPERVRATHYDVVLNGVELGSGSLRNHRGDVQRKIFDVLGYEKADMERRFGFLLNALDAGAPPHGGFAFGFDRTVMLLAGAENLRDVIAFPKTQRGQDLLMEAPSEVDADQLEELRVRIVRERKGS